MPIKHAPGSLQEEMVTDLCNVSLHSKNKKGISLARNAIVIWLLYYLGVFIGLFKYVVYFFIEDKA